MLWDNSLIDLFHKGGFAMWPLLACSVLGLAIIVERTVVICWYHGNFSALLRRLRPLLAARRFDDARSELRRWRLPAARVAEEFLEHLDREAVVRKEFCEREGAEQIAALENRVSWLAAIAQIAPMLGLLGTVTGLVGAFHAIELQRGAVQPSDLAAGIWEALITTVFGLVVAIPCMAAFHFLDNRLARLAVRLEWIVSYMEQWTQHESPVAAPGRRPSATVPRN